MIHGIATRNANETICGLSAFAVGIGFAWRKVTCPDCLKNEKIDLGGLDVRSSWSILTGKVEDT